MAFFETSPQTPLHILRRRQVEEQSGLKRSTLYQEIKEGRFPKPIRLGKRAVGWLEADVQAWLQAKIKETRGQAA